MLFPDWLCPRRRGSGRVSLKLLVEGAGFIVQGRKRFGFCTDRIVTRREVPGSGNSESTEYIRYFKRGGAVQLRPVVRAGGQKYEYIHARNVLSHIESTYGVIRAERCQDMQRLARRVS